MFTLTFDVMVVVVSYQSEKLGGVYGGSGGRTELDWPVQERSDLRY